jgi:hypothetical protein
LKNIPLRVRKSDHRTAGPSVVDRKVQAGGLSDCGLFQTFGQVERAPEDLLKSTGLDGVPVRLHKSVNKGNIPERLDRLLQVMKARHLLSSGELHLAEKFARDSGDSRADVAMRNIRWFCDTAEAAWARRAY